MMYSPPGAAGFSSPQQPAAPGPPQVGPPPVGPPPPQGALPASPATTGNLHGATHYASLAGGAGDVDQPLAERFRSLSLGGSKCACCKEASDEP